MIQPLRQRFNASYEPSRYARFLALLEERSGAPALFRHCETPIFLPQALVDRMAKAGEELCHQIAGNPAYLADAQRAIPPAFDVPHTPPHPLFVQVDFGLVQDAAGAWQPRLVEIQGFPSLYAYQPVMAACYCDAYELDETLWTLPGGMALETYHASLRDAIVGDADPRETVLLEIDPQNQKTRADFLMTEKLFGVAIVDVATVRREGRQLLYECHGRRVPIRRIYTRVIVDELVRRQVPLPFDFRDDLDVQWAGHPNWYFLLSKYSLPFLQHETVPETRFLADFDPLPDDLHEWVLKPLFSFAGLGVVLGPTREQIEAIPAGQRRDYVLQRRVHFAASVETPYGPNKAEIRMMYLWRDRLEVVNTIIRMGRGAMMGVDHNRNLEWVGASAALLTPETSF